MDCYQYILSAVASAGGGYLRNVVMEMVRAAEMTQQQEKEKDEGASADEVEYLSMYHNNFDEADFPCCLSAPRRRSCWERERWPSRRTSRPASSRAGRVNTQNVSSIT